LWAEQEKITIEGNKYRSQKKIGRAKKKESLIIVEGVVTEGLSKIVRISKYRSDRYSQAFQTSIKKMPQGTALRTYSFHRDFVN